MELQRYARIATRHARLCLARDMQYRAHFVGRTVAWLFWTGMYLAFIEVILAKVGAIGGWGRPQMYVLYGTYMLVDGVSQVVIRPNASEMASYVPKGTLDLVLTRPVDPQFFVSVARWDFMGVGSMAVGMAVVAVALPSATPLTIISLAGYALALVCGVAVLYSCWFISSLLVFWTMRLDGIGAIFTPFFQVCRYPVAAYPRAVRGVLKTVLPMAFVVTVPAGTLLGLGGWHQALSCVLAAALSLAAARLVWRAALRSYASASS